jgi:hypothetical protein
MCCVWIFLAISGTAISGTIDLTISDWSKLSTNWVTLAGSKYNNTGVSAGSFTASSTNPSFTTNVFCVELTQGIGESTYTFNINDFDDFSAAQNARYQKAGWLMDKYSNLIGTTNSGALQLAIWEVLYDDTFNLTGGNFKVNQSASYGSLLSDITTTFNNASGNYNFDMNRFAIYTSPTVQNLIGINPVPEPATMLLFGAGLIGLAGRRLRRK